MTKKELKNKLISEAQAGWKKLDMIKRVCGSEFSYYDGYVDCGTIKEKRIAELEAQIEKMQEKLKADLIARLEEQMQYSTSPSCTKGMELFIKSIEEWEIKEK